MLTRRPCAIFCNCTGAGFTLSALQQHLMLFSAMKSMPASGLKAGVGKEDCIQKALNKLKESDQNQGVFRSALFKSIESFRGSESFIDVNYYLLFSALESLSRYHLDDYDSKNVSTPIAKFLKPYNFDISQDNVKNLTQSVSTYTHLRNALFHNGKLECEPNINGTYIKLEMSEYYANFSMLVPLVMLKYIGFDDGYTNWNSWLDRMPFK